MRATTSYPPAARETFPSSSRSCPDSERTAWPQVYLFVNQAIHLITLSVLAPISVCGNGIVEGWEECDCGVNEEECSDNKCCHPADHPEKPCQLREGAKCRFDTCSNRKTHSMSLILKLLRQMIYTLYSICYSPTEGSCCSVQCEFVQPSTTNSSVAICREETECSFASECDGVNAMCPKAKAKRSGNLCQGGTKVGEIYKILQSCA